MSKSKIAALIMIVVWPIAMFNGKTYGGFLHLALMLTLFLWFNEWSANREEPKRSKRHSAR